MSVRLSQAALIEAVSIAAEARTAAIIDAHRRTEEGIATGTGTDCIVVAAPKRGGQAASFAGLHTHAGRALGAAVYDAVRKGAQDWIAEREGGGR